jgi:uncharacterized protein YjiS (DUF1127 family)
MEETLHSQFRLSSLDRRGDNPRRAARSAVAVRVSSVTIIDMAAQHGSFLWASPGTPLTRRTPLRRETRNIPILRAIRRIFAVIRLWRRRVHSRQQLGELSDHVLKDIGLRRENAGYELPRPVWH